MIAIAKTPRNKRFSPRWNDRFLALLPAIQDQAEYAFRRLPVESREELVQQAIASSYDMFIRLCRRGKTGLVYATPLAKFAICHVREGRRTGSRCNSRDLMSPRACAAKGFTIERLDRFDRRSDQWREVLVEDWRSGPDEIAAIRIDFADWLKTLSTRDRKLAETLAMGETTGRVARTFRISAARVSQLRRELCANWRRFVGELTDAGAPSLATV
jgi:hypothetical protein